MGSFISITITGVRKTGCNLSFFEVAHLTPKPVPGVCTRRFWTPYLLGFGASSHYSATSHGKFTPFLPDIAHLETLGIYGAFMGLRVENAQKPMEEQNRIMGF